MGGVILLSISEYQLINKLLEDKDYSLLVDNMLTEEHFTQAREEYNYIINFYDNYKSVPDKETFTAKFPKFDYFKVSQPISSIVDALREQALFRRAVNVLNHSTELFENDAVAGAEFLLSKIEELRPQVEFSCTDILHDDKRYKEYINNKDNSDDNYIPLPFSELNDTLGGYQKGEELFFWLGRSGYGKTQVLTMSIAHASKLGYNIGVISPELSKNKLGFRIDSCLGHFSNTALNAGLNLDGYKEYMENLFKSDNHIYVADTDDFTSGTVKVSQIRNFILAKKLDILFIDGFEYIIPDGDIKHKTVSECMGIVSKQLFQLSKSLHIPIVCAIQARRRSGEKKGNEEDTISDSQSIYNSYGVTQSSTRIVSINRITNTNATKLCCVKNRYGLTDKEWIYNFDFDRMTFNFIPDIEDLNSTEEGKQELEETKESFKNVF